LAVLVVGLVVAAGAAGGGSAARAAADRSDTSAPIEDRGPVTRWVGPGTAGPRTASVTGTVACDGNGSTGKRVQVLYVREPSQSDRLGQYQSTFQEWASQIDQAFLDGAQATGGYRRVRFVHDASCVPTVTRVVVPAGSLADFGRTFDALKSAGYGRTDRKYVAYAETDAWCGLGGGGPGAGDDRPGSANRYNSGPELATVGSGCWGWAPTAHELLHTMGAVLAGAPHASAHGHCWDDEDIMCYDDGGLPNPPGGLVKVCAGAPENQLDCGHDDYYSTRPPTGSWLANHWNVANSQFLIAAPNLDFPSYPAAAVGATGPAVEAAEYLLQQAGFAPGPADGVFDGATAAAVTGFRQDRGLPSGSTLDSRVWTALLAAGSTPTIRRGASGPDVRRLQRSLTAALGRTVAIDSAFGSGTEQAVRDYQSARGLGSDGIVGPATWAALQAGR
jgi:peptidoglycan hydrolase-like protein with peptidoglycan-binding domain